MPPQQSNVCAHRLRGRLASETKRSTQIWKAITRRNLLRPALAGRASTAWARWQQSSRPKGPLLRRRSLRPRGGREHPASRAQSPLAQTWFADTAAAMILRRRSSSDGTRAAAPASRNAVEPKKPAGELPGPTERQRPQSSWSRQWQHAVWQTEARDLPLSVAVRKVWHRKSPTFSPLRPAN